MDTSWCSHFWDFSWIASQRQLQLFVYFWEFALSYIMLTFWRLCKQNLISVTSYQSGDVSQNFFSKHLGEKCKYKTLTKNNIVKKNLFHHLCTDIKQLWSSKGPFLKYFFLWGFFETWIFLKKSQNPYKLFWHQRIMKYTFQYVYSCVDYLCLHLLEWASWWGNSYTHK